MNKVTAPFLAAAMAFAPSVCALAQDSNNENQDSEPIEQLTPTYSIPVMYVNTENSAPIVSKTEYINATAFIEVPEGSSLQPLASADKPVELEIRGRGNSSWVQFDKKPYRCKFAKKQEVLGMPKSKHWVLMAYAADHLDYLNDAAAYQLGRLMGTPWQPRLQPVELVLNGQYVGLYMIQENIRIDKDRINIYEQKDNETDPSLVTGGWLLEFDNYYDECQVIVNKSDDRILRVTHQSPEELSDIQRSWLIDEMQTITDAIYSRNYTDAEWAYKIDVESLAKYFIIRELFDDPDGFNGSFYLYKDLADDARWTFGTMWDVSNQWREKTDFTINMPVAWECAFHWVEELQYHPVFADAVKTVWEETYPDKLDELYSFIASFMAPLAQADAQNNRLWGMAEHITNNLKVNDLTSILRKNALWMNDNYLRLLNTPSTDGIDTPFQADASTIEVTGHTVTITMPLGSENAQPVITTVTGTSVAAKKCGRHTWKATMPGPGIYIVAGSKVAIR